MKRNLTDFAPIYPIPYFPNNKFVVNITSLLNVSSIYKMDLGIKIPESFAKKGYDIKFNLVDQRRSCRRPLGVNDMLFSGDEIVYEFEYHIDKVYSVEIRYICTYLSFIHLN